MLGLDALKQDKNDDADDRLCKRLLYDIVTSALTPSSAAADFDSYVVRESTRRLDLLENHPSFDLTPEEEDNSFTTRMISPNASGLIENSFQLFAATCAAIPPGHAGQDALVEFVQALRALPVHRASDAIPTETDDGFMDLWPIEENWQALAEIFRKEAANYFHPASGMGVPESKQAHCWRNLQSAMARLTALGLINCGFLCSLEYILPSSPYYPRKSRPTVDQVNVLASNAIAGTQWLVPGTIDYVYAQCSKVKSVSAPREMWSRERWSEWQRQLALLASNDLVYAEARTAAKKALDQMNRTESSST